MRSNRYRRVGLAIGGGLVLVAALVLLQSPGAGLPPSPTPLGIVGGGALTSQSPTLRPSATETLLPVEPSATATQLPVEPSPSVAAAASLFPGGLLIADRKNGRLIVIDDAGNILWRFPVAGSLPPGQKFSADDAFVTPDGKAIVANEESNQVIVRIDIATQKIVWQYGTFDTHGSGAGELSTPDDAYPLPNGDVTVADIKNCRILEIAPDMHIVRQWGTTRVCRDNPPFLLGSPNGDTPLPDGGMLITEIDGSRVVRLSASGAVVFNIHVPARYPSDAQLLPDGNVLVADYSNPGAILVVDPATERVVYSYAQSAGDGRLDHPSLAVPLANGSFVVNDDGRNRVVVIDPATNGITWSYGHLDQAGSGDGYLDVPDGVDVVPPGVFR